jgi:16S rRNA (guanine1207-N2)-methyltransferase
MLLTNTSQILLRNSALLKAKSPLLVNMPADDLHIELLALNPLSDVHYFTNNYAQYQHYNKVKNTRLYYYFSAYYQANTSHDLVIIHFPKSKQELVFTLAMIAMCTNVDSQILIVGDNKGGIKSLKKLTENTFSYCDKLDAARHCLLFQAQLNDSNAIFNIDDWFHHYQININNTLFTIASLPGVFSQAKLDRGTAILLELLGKFELQTNNTKLLDFGCGAGVIACFMGLTRPETELHLTDVSALAIASAKKTLELNNLSGRVFATDSLSNINDTYQHIISNPPFHQGVKTNYQATEQFLLGIKPYLSDGGTLTIVANSFLHYQGMIKKSLGHSEELYKKAGFTVYHAKNKLPRQKKR